MDKTHESDRHMKGGKTTPSEIMQMMKDGGKNIPAINRFIDTLRMQKSRVTARMAVIMRALHESGELDIKLMDEYQELNHRLKNLKIQEAEYVYLRNLL